MKEDVSLLRVALLLWGLALIVGMIFSLWGGGSALWFISSVPAYICAVIIYAILKQDR